MRNWAELHHDVLVEITQCITSYEDFIAFRWVCSSWESAAINENFRFMSIQTPWLMLLPKSGDVFAHFFSLSTSKCFPTMLHDIRHKRLFSSEGWLVTIDYKNCSIGLLHPFTRSQIRFPSFRALAPHYISIDYSDPKYPDTYIQRCVLSSMPSLKSDYIMMVIYGLGYLAYARPGDKTWTRLSDFSYADVTYCKSKFYAIDRLYRIHVFDVGSGNPSGAWFMKLELVEQFYNLSYFSKRLYILESAGALLVVLLISGMDDSKRMIHRFRIFNINTDNGISREIKDLGNKTLFLCQNSSMSIESSASSHCRANCIYYIDDDSAEKIWYDDNMFYYYKRLKDKYMKIYNMQDESVEEYKYEIDSNPTNSFTPLMWVKHSFL